MTVLSAFAWRNNAQLIAEAIVPLGYIKPTDRVIDLTFGRGKWWTQYQHPPERFIGCVRTITAMEANEWSGSLRIIGDYRDLRVPSNDYQEKFDVVVFDPPYVSMGGRSTSGAGMADFVDRFGLADAPATPLLMQEDIGAGLLQASFITEPGGLILVKCANYISSGKLWPGVHLTWTAARSYKLELVDEFTHVGHVRAQPSGRRVVHARQNASTLFVFRNPRPRRRKKAPDA